MNNLNFKTLRRANAERGIEWTGGPVEKTPEEILFRSVELGGEAGEVLDAVKKLVRFIRGHKGGTNPLISRQAIKEELGDVVICADRIAEALDIDLGEAVQEKFNLTSAKYALSVTIPTCQVFEVFDAAGNLIGMKINGVNLGVVPPEENPLQEKLPLIGEEKIPNLSPAWTRAICRRCASDLLGPICNECGHDNRGGFDSPGEESESKKGKSV